MNLKKLAELLRDNDILLAVGLVVIVTMMIIPLPSVVLDILLTVNISLSLIIMLVCLYTSEPLQYSSFPTILLVATLFRLGLNVSSTRLILLYGDAGEVIDSFGQFVIGGNYVVGAVIFAILVIINFMVITNGAGRVAEVAARFTLDSMPGKQLSIDADMNSGLINEEEAKARRRKIEREADFYGTMDGASKFVKGDATAGIIITIVNIIGGLIIGMAQQGMDFATAATTFTILTVGDGLVSQLPALIISTSTGLIVSRASGQDKSLSQDIQEEMFGDPKVLFIVSGLLIVFGIVPGLPTIPFWLIGFSLGFCGYSRYKGLNKKKDEEAQVKQASFDAKQGKAEGGGVKPLASRESVMELLTVEPMEIEIGYRLVPLLDIEQGGDLLERIAQIRKQTALDFGIVLPSIRVRDNLQLSPNTYQIKLKGIPVESGEVYPDKFLAMDSGMSAGVKIDGLSAVEPAFGLPAIWIEERNREFAESNGYTVVSPSAVVSTHLTEIIKKNAASILSRDDVNQLLDNLKKTSEALIDDTLKDVSTSEIQIVLQNLLREKVPVRDLQTILETISTYSKSNKNSDFLTEQCRMSLARSICKQNLTDSGELLAITLSPEIENAIASGISQDRQNLTLDPIFTRRMIDNLNSEIEKVLTTIGQQPVILCSSPIRIAFRKLIERTFPQISVMSYNEISQNINAKSVGVVRVDLNKSVT
ncbi:MAG: flagellar biosynthesis protein FlhA [Candidatus Gastranaerophilales bacterium]|nr:flagellar biosynthesis protein FlhA [Candidatus Gastranaerophilales bacterium]